MKYGRNIFFAILGITLFLALGFVGIEKRQERSIKLDKVHNSIQEIGSQLHLLQDVSEYLEKRIQDRALATYARQVDSVANALHRDFCYLVIQNRWEASYHLLPEDNDLLLSLRAKYQLSNQDFFQEIIYHLNSLEKKSTYFSAAIDHPGWTVFLDKMNASQQEWKNKALKLEAINRDMALY